MTQDTADFRQSAQTDGEVVDRIPAASKAGQGLSSTVDELSDRFKSRMQSHLLLVTGMIILFGLLTWPTWRWLWGEWMANDYYSHGLLILPVALFLAWRRLTFDSEMKPKKLSEK